MLETGLRDRVCVVTGAAGGIGKACAELLAAEGAEVVFVDVREDEHQNGHWLTGDLRSRADVERIFGEVRDRYGRLDVLIHCAGIYRVTPLLEVTDEEWDSVIDTNLRSAFLAIQSALPIMQEQGDGRIVLFSSAAARTGGLASGGVHYVASKAGVSALVRNVAKYAGPLGIRVNAVAPGFIDTPMSAMLSSEARNAAAAGAPLKRTGRPSEPATMAVVLASDLASYVHGATIDVNGGSFMA